MQTTYIIKDNNIYEVIGENEAVKIDIVKGVPKKGKETVEYNPATDFPYAFFEIRAKYSYLFEQQEEPKIEINLDSEKVVEEIKEEKPIKSKSKTETKNND